MFNQRKRYDERGRRITTYEGYTGYVDDSIREYFLEQYEKQDWKVVPGHWPTMETKEDVDNWITSQNELMETIRKTYIEKNID
ncbi:hypothetical protein [Vagococcus fluvialis]|uniref:hypothetical protein n=1 Tax=Vagococcus fluvialis TaxID=2738 RepID=UPI003B21DA05